MVTAAAGWQWATGGVRRADHAWRTPHGCVLRPLRRAAGGAGRLDDTTMAADAALRPAERAGRGDPARPYARRLARVRTLGVGRQVAHRCDACRAGRASRGWSATEREPDV